MKSVEKPRARTIGIEPAVVLAEVGHAVDEDLDEDGSAESENDPEDRDPLDCPDLRQVGRGEHDAEQDDPDRERFSASGSPSIETAQTTVAAA